ncbi:Fe-S metabolism protein SufE [Shewanella sp. OPT22]|nr:Fe-S metabolism protein SufE [Shewanella sp. OPT22]
MPHPLPDTQDFHYTIPELSEITKTFLAAKNWQEKYRQLMLLGKRAPKLKPEFKVETAKIDGCESDAWLYHKVIEGNHYFIADSDARIVKGLIVILLAVFHNQNTKPNLDIQQLFTELGLYTQLSPSRTNGVAAMAEAIELSF